MFRKANKNEINDIVQIYDDINDYLESNINYTHWKKGVYPIREDAEAAFEKNELFVFENGGEILGTVVLNSSEPPQYANVNFDNRFKGNEILVIHTLVVSPKSLRKGVGEAILQSSEAYALTNNCKTIRLDTYYKNEPAISLYTKMFYNFVGMVDLELGFEGLFKCFEKNI